MDWHCYFKTYHFSIALYLSKVDLESALNQLKLQGQEKWKTDFIYSFGLLKYLAILFGLKTLQQPFKKVYL